MPFFLEIVKKIAYYYISISKLELLMISKFLSKNIGRNNAKISMLNSSILLAWDRLTSQFIWFIIV